MFFDRANPDFLPRSTGQSRVCAFLFKEAHEISQRHQTQQEIRGSVMEYRPRFTVGVPWDKRFPLVPKRTLKPVPARTTNRTVQAREMRDTTERSTPRRYCWIRSRSPFDMGRRGGVSAALHIPRIDS